MNSIFKPTFILVSVCLIITSLVAMTNYVTKDTIEMRQEEEARVLRQEVLEADEFVEDEELYTLAGELVDDKEEIYVGYSNDEMKGYVFFVSEKGYASQIEVIIGIDNSGIITGVKIGENSETPGLGKNIEKEKFTARYDDKNNQQELVVVKGNSTEDNEISAVTGATISSRGVTNAVNRAIDIYNIIVGGEGN